MCECIITVGCVISVAEFPSSTFHYQLQAPSSKHRLVWKLVYCLCWLEISSSQCRPAPCFPTRLGHQYGIHGLSGVFPLCRHGFFAALPPTIMFFRLFFFFLKGGGGGVASLSVHERSGFTSFIHLDFAESYLSVSLKF